MAPREVRVHELRDALRHGLGNELGLRPGPPDENTGKRLRYGSPNALAFSADDSPSSSFAGVIRPAGEVVAQLGPGAVLVGVGDADGVVDQLPSVSEVSATCTVRSSVPRTTRSSRVPPCAPWSAPNRSSTPSTGWPAAATIRSPEVRPARTAGTPARRGRAADLGRGRGRRHPRADAAARRGRARGRAGRCGAEVP